MAYVAQLYLPPPPALMLGGHKFAVKLLHFLEQARPASVLLLQKSNESLFVFKPLRDIVKILLRLLDVFSVRCSELDHAPTMPNLLMPIAALGYKL